MDTSEGTLRKWEEGRSALVTAYPKIIHFLGCEPWSVPTTLAEQIRPARYRRGLRIDDAAKLLGVNPSTFWWWENGRKPHRHADRARITEFVGAPSVASPTIVTKPANDHPPDAPDIGTMIKDRRSELGLTQPAAATHLGVNKWTVINWENAFNAPSDRLYPSLIRFLGFEPWPRPKTIGERLHAERMRRGLSRIQVAALLQVDDGSVAAWEADPGRYHKFAKAKVEAFLSGDTRPRRTTKR